MFIILTFGIHVYKINAIDNNNPGTIVGGIISENTTWTLKNSPYKITDVVQIPETVTLLIEPGVTIIDNRPSYSGEAIYFSGKIFVKGTKEERITFNGNNHEAWFGSVDGSNTACLILDYCIFKNGSAIFRDIRNYYSLIIKNSLFKVPLDSSGRFGVRMIGENCTIEHNILFNACTIEAIDFSKPLYIMYNVFYGVKGDLLMGITLENCALTMKFNSFINLNPEENKVRYFKELDITENYWGTINTTIIDQIIIDRNDYITYTGYVSYLPILTEPSLNGSTLPLNVNFMYLPLIPYALETITFDASASFGIYSNISNFIWNFGDGNITTFDKPVITHVYNLSGSYNVTLSVTDEFGFKNSTIKSFTVLQDNVPPTTTHDYDNKWRTVNFPIPLPAIDYESGIKETYYRINDGSIKTVSTDGQPLIVSENANNTLEYWSIDNSGNEEVPHNILSNIKLDKTAPTIMITSPSLGSVIKSSRVTVTWTASDNVSGINHYEVRPSDESNWFNGTATSYIYNEFGQGTHTIEVKAIDNAGNTNQETTKYIMNTSLIGGPEWTDDIIIFAGIIIIIVVVLIYILKLRKR